MKKTDKELRAAVRQVIDSEVVADRVHNFVSKYVSPQYGVIIYAHGKMSPMYTSSVRAMAFIMQDGGGIGDSGGIVYQLVPWSDTDVACEVPFTKDGIFAKS